MEKRMDFKDALNEALSALHILASQECSEKLTPTLSKNCKERKKRFLRAFETIKEQLAKI